MFENLECVYECAPALSKTRVIRLGQGCHGYGPRAGPSPIVHHIRPVVDMGLHFFFFFFFLI